MGPAPMQDTAAGSMVTVTGWGTTSEGALGLPNVLHKVDVPVVSDEECNAAYGAAGYAVADSMICAGLPEGGKDSCQGDSGGPFFSNQSPETRELVVEELATLESTLRFLTLLNGSQKQWPPTKFD